MSDMIIKRIEFDPEFEPLMTLSPIIKLKVMKATEKAREILDKAHGEAVSVKQRAANILEEAEVEKKRRTQSGYDEGYQNGRAEWTEKILEASLAQEKTLSESEPQIVRMVMDISEKVIGREVEKGAVLDVIRKSIAEVAGNRVTVRVHPQDISFVKEHEAALVSSIDRSRAMTMREDDSVSPGGCIVETEFGTVDARLEVQLEAIRKALGL